MENAPRQAGWEIGAEIERAIFFDFPCEIDARIFLRQGELDIGIRLVVAQHDVEFGLVLLDQVVFEGQSLALVVNDNAFNVGNFEGERAGFGIGPARLEKVRAHTVAKRARFAYVNDRCSSVPEQVDARGIQQLCGFFAGFHALRPSSGQ